MNSNLMDQTIQRYDQIAQEYFEIWASDDCMATYLNKFISFLPEKASVIDIGCGTGRDLKYMKEKGLNVIGIDLSIEMLKIAKKLNPNVEFKLMDMRNLEFKNLIFDGIWANASLLHIFKNEINIVFEHLYRILKNNGILFLSLQQPIDEKKEKETNYETFDSDGRLFVRYKENELLNLIRNHKFKIIEIIHNESNKNTYNQILTIKWMNLYVQK